MKTGMGGQGAMHGGQGAMNGGQGGMNRGQGAMNGGQGLAFGGIMPVLPNKGFGNLPCWTNSNISLSIVRNKNLIMTGFPTSSLIFNYTSPFDLTKIIQQTQEIITYGITGKLVILHCIR